MSETFLSRWSRRKRAASVPAPQGEGGEDRRSEPGGGASPPPAGHVESPPHSDPLPASGERETASRAGGGEPHGQAPQEAEFDPASLPPIESIDAGTDVGAFLRPGVPADLTQAALRRAWVTDPAIRDFVGLAENAWDFNAPGGVPGFEPLRAIDDVQRLAAQVLGTLPVAPPETAPAESKETGGTIEEGVRPVLQDTPPETAAPADDAAVQDDRSTQKT
jgi:Protein of unknown function (DUF3306)